MVTAIFLAVAVIATCVPFFARIRLKKATRAVCFFDLPKATAAFLKAVLRGCLRLVVCVLKTLPPETLRLGARFNQEANGGLYHHSGCNDVGNSV